MILHAGSLYRDNLVLYAEGVTPHIIQVTNQDLQWNIYCNDVELVGYIHDDVILVFQGKQHTFPCTVTETPMKTLGFLS